MTLQELETATRAAQDAVDDYLATHPNMIRASPRYLALLNRASDLEARLHRATRRAA